MKNNKKIFILVLLLVIGFASVSATLVITGVIGISTKKSDFSVKFTNAKLGEVERKDFINADDPKLLDYTIEDVTEVGASTTLNYEVTNTSRVYDAEVNVTCNIVDNADNPITSEYISMDYAPKEKLTIRAGQTESGSITTTLIKSSTTAQSINVRCELKAEATERTSLGEGYKESPALPAGVELIEDKGTIGTLDVGDKIKVGTENFYVISHTDTELNALAEYNLNIGSNLVPDATYGIQNEKARGWMDSSTGIPIYGTVRFSKTNAWTSEEPPRLNPIPITTIDYRFGLEVDPTNKDKFSALDVLYTTNATAGITGYQDYIKGIVPESVKEKISVRLINKKEIEDLLGITTPLASYTSIKIQADSKQYQWLYYTTYWTQTADSVSSSGVWSVGSNGDIGSRNFDLDNVFGVRPVITISLS